MGKLAKFIFFYTDEDEGVKPVPVEWETATGVSPLSLVNALAHSIKRLTQYGKLSVSGSTITCNNGELKVVNNEIIADGTPEVVTLSASGGADQTATAENLFAVDNITDEQDIITGKVIRRTEAVVSDGTTPSGRYVGEVGVGNIIVKARETGYTGEIVSFTTEEETPLNGLRVNFEPVQDLHGYDNPWPAGGGKNKFDIGAMVATTHITISNGVISVTGNGRNSTKKLSDLASLVEGETYILSATSTGVANYIYLSGANETWYFGTSRTITQADLNSNVLFYSGGADVTANISNMMIRLSSISDASFAPYSNLCPIYGFTGLNVYGTGVNVWDEEWEVGLLNSDGSVSSGNRVVSKDYIPVVPNKTYCFSLPNGTFAAGRGAYYDADKNLVQYLGDFPTGFSVSGDRQFALFTVPENASYLKFCTNGQYGTTYNNDISINYPSTDADYHTYVGTTLPVSWQSEAGTVYAGYLSIDKDGNVTLTGPHAMADMGSLNWSYTPSYGFISTSLSSVIKNAPEYSQPANILCSSYKTSNYNAVIGGTTNGCIAVSGGTYGFVVVSNDAYTDADVFKAAMSGVQLLYELATPVTYTLSSVTLPSTVQGENNIWSDANSINVYVPSGEVVEQVTPQKLKTAEGTNTVTVTAEVSPIQLSVEYAQPIAQ